MTNDLTIIALLNIWNELPVLAGDRWKQLEPKLRVLLDAFEATTDSSVQAQICSDIQQILASVPEVIDRFDDEFVQISHVEQGQTRGNISSQIAQLLGRRCRPVRTFTRYTDISCPRRVWVETRRISVVVRLTLRPSVYSDSAEELLVSSESPIWVRIDAPGFEVLGLAEQEMAILPNADSLPLVFDVCPIQVGHASITFDFFQSGNPVGTASIPVEITASEISVVGQTQSGPLLRSGEGVEPPDFILYITYECFLTPPALSFELRSAGGVGQKFAPIPLNVTPEEHSAQAYRRLTDLAIHYDPTTHAVLGKMRTLPAKDAEARLQEEGQALWRDLIPLELRTRYAKEHEQWRDKSLLIVSDEPYIPWELLWPYDEWGNEGPLCLQMRTARWIRRGPQGNATYEPEPAPSLNALAVVVPPDSGLPAAQRERSFIAALMRQHGLRDVSPAEPTRTAVKQVLQEGHYTWVHVAAHGNFYPDDPNGESAIWLMDKQPLTSNAIVGDAEIYLNKHRPAFVFNACEVGRQGWAITGLGGWANRLIGAGAGLFLAPLLLVDDNAALKFSKTVYQSLLAGETVAEAVRRGRLTARREGDPTWLAYSLYAHPNARVIQPTQPQGLA